MAGVSAGGGAGVKRIYVAGPYTQPDPAANAARAVEAANRIFDAGYWPYIPHLTHFWHPQIPRPYEDWMALDLVWLEVCDALVRLPGDSPGADREVAQAQELGIPVFRGVGALLAEMGVAG